MSEGILYEEWNQLGRILGPFLIRAFAAAICGALIGLEREMKGKPAGFRTNILICLGASMYMAVGLLLVHEAGETDSDSARIAAQVVTGIGFLGAGSIIKDRGEVRGLTTAATIWVVAAIGIIAGAGFPILAFVATLIVLATLALLRSVEKVLDRKGEDEDAR